MRPNHGIMGLPGYQGGALIRILRNLFKGGKRLSMDTASRMRRAMDMGFDTDLFFHGTKQDIRPRHGLSYGPKPVSLPRGGGIMRRGGDWTTLEPSDVGDMGRGIYLSGNKGADAYSLGGKGAWGRPGSTPRTYPVRIRSDRILKTEYVNEYGEIFEGHPEYYRIKKEATERLRRRADLDPELADALEFSRETSGPWGNTPPELQQEIIDVAKESGYEGLWKGVSESLDPQVIPNPNVMIFESKNIRSPYAAFDPKKRHVADLMAGIAGLAATGAVSNALRDDQRKWHPPMRLP